MCKSDQRRWRKITLRRCIQVFSCYCLINTGILYAETSAQWSYHWGRGLEIPAAKLALGGYLKASYTNLESEDQDLVLNSLALFISWRPFKRLHIFSELEMDELISLDGVANFEDSFRVERLYADILINNAATLRLGQYLIPFSRWNLIHIAPLVWTTSRPLVTEPYFVPNHGSGMELLLRTNWLERELNVSVYAEDTKDLQIDAFKNPLNYGAGVRANYQAHRTLNLGLSFLFSNIDYGDKGENRYSVGFDLLWRKQGYEAQMESVFKLRSNRLPQYGFYLQGVAPLMDKLFAVSRYEFTYDGDLQQFDNPNPNRITHIGVVGLTWRPFAPLALKAEYRLGDNNESIAPSGFLFSISTLF